MEKLKNRYKDDKMEHPWSLKSNSLVCSNHFSEYILDYPNLNLGYNAKSKLKLSVPAVVCSKRSLTYITGNYNSVQSISTNTNHGVSKQDKVGFYSSSLESVLKSFNKLPLNQHLHH